MVKIKQFLIVLTIILLVNPISFAQIILAEGTLVDESFIEIETSEDLAAIKDDLTENYVLTDDIDLKYIEWEPIDTGEFTGALIGNEFKVINMPAKYLEDENYGLFTEVADIRNADVDIEFEEEIKKPKVEEETGELETEEEVIEKELEEPQEEIVEEEIEGAQSEEKTAIESKITPRAMGVDVASFTEFRSALENRSVTEINLTSNISAKAASTSIGNRIDIAPREVVINGNGNEIRQTTGGNYSMMRMNAGKVNDVANITFKNVDMVSTSGNSLLTENGSTDWLVTFENVNSGENGFNPSNGRLVSSDYAHVILKNKVSFITTNKDIINGAISVTVESDADVSMLSQTGRFYKTDAVNAELLIKNGGKLDLEGSEGEQNLIEFGGSSSKVSVIGGTLNIKSKRVYKDITGDWGKDQIRSGLIKLNDKDSSFNVSDAGNVDIKHKQGSILYMNSNNGQINISNKNTKVMFTVDGLGTDSNHDAAIHLDKAENYNINVTDGSHFEVNKNSGAAMGIRVGQGAGHEVNVTEGAKFKIHNKGNKTVTNPAGENARNQALYYNGELPKFHLTGKGSEVELIADFGVAMHMTGGGDINVGEGTTMIARGQTGPNDKGRSDKNGIIDTGGAQDDNSQIILNKPAYYDFRNENTEGVVFLVGQLAKLHGHNTDIAFWQKRKNTNLDGKPDYRFWNVFRFQYHGANYKFFSKAYTGHVGLEKMHEQISEGGLNGFARISGNNAQPEVNDLYLPTNADTKIYAQVSVDEGIFGKRDAHNNEVEIDVKHTKKSDGTEQTLTGETIGQEEYPEKGVYEIYGKPVDPEIGAFGWVEIKLPNNAYLETGDTLKVVGARIVGANHTTTESNPDNLFSEIRSVVDVTPPEPTKLKTKNLTTTSKIIEGEDADPDATVIIKINDEIVAEDIQVAKDGTWEYEFQKNKLKTDDKVQAFLTDNAERVSDSLLGTEADRPDRPITHTSKGNINPAEEEFTYHDKTFKPAPFREIIGELKLLSYPESLNFNAKIKPKTDEYLMDEIPDSNDHLVVSDTRRNKVEWHLNAKVAPFTDNSGKSTDKLALIYHGNKKFEPDGIKLNDINQTIESHKYGEDPNTDKEMFNLSENWFTEKKGMFIRVEPGIVKEDYKSEVIWTLSDAPQ